VPQKLVSDKPQKIHDIPRDVLKDNERQRRVYSKEGKSPTLLARADSPKVMKSDKPQHIGTAVDVNGFDIQKRVYSVDGKSPTIMEAAGTGGGRVPKVVVGAYRGRYNEDGSTSQKLELRKDEKTNTITTVQKDNVLTKDEVYWRKLTPLECERLQTVPDNYTNHVSNTQRYKMLGNGWTIEVIAHILKNMEV
jgi:site-specific DNA-cytosine methylase